MFTTKVQTLAPATVSEASDETLIVMSPDARTQLLSQWWEHQGLNAGDRDERKKLATGQPREAIDAWAEVSDLVDEGSVGVVLLLADLVDAGPPDTGPSVVRYARPHSLAATLRTRTSRTATSPAQH